MDRATIKSELMKMAQNGAPRPTIKECRFAKYIWDFTSKKSRKFDLKFSNELRKAAPQWFVFDSKDERLQKRQQFQESLLELATHGYKKPKGGDQKLRKLLWEYTNKNSKNYDLCFTKKLAKIAPDWISYSKEGEKKRSKNKLLNLARSGAPRPKWKDRSLGSLMQRYTSESSPSYDHEFTLKLQKIAPHWFPKKTKTVKEKKDAILNLALSGEPRPRSKKSQSGSLIWTYTSPKSKGYDPKFAEELKRIAPHWFVFPTVELQKAEIDREKEFLLSVARSGIPRPIYVQKSREAKLLKKFTHPSSKSFDEKFKIELKKCAPHWFENLRPNKRNRIKNLLIQMAENGEPKPTFRKDGLGKKFSDFTDKFGRQYDAEFTEKIKKTAPHWFEKKIDQDKDRLLSLAKAGGPRPQIRGSSIGLKLSRFTNPKHQCFDAYFNEKIRKLRPEWFIKPTILIKAQLYEMAMTGQPRPKKNSTLTRRLSDYMRVKSERYDETFAEKIKILAPHWFQRGSNGKKQSN